MSAKKSNGPVFDPGLCRCCGTMKKCRMLNFEYEYFGQKEIYSDMFMDCFGLLISCLDGKPTERLVCATCVKRLREAFAFRKQVLQCEETFIQMRMCDAKTESSQGLNSDLEASWAKIEVEVVKSEPDSGPASPASPPPRDALADHGADDAYTRSISSQDEEPDSLKPEIMEIDDDDLPLRPSKAKPQATAQASTQAISDQAKPKIRQSVNGKKEEEKQKPLISDMASMLEVQQRIRDRDPTYKKETNVLTIVEYSYVCPFKCRHNNLICYYCGETYTDPALLREHTEKVHHPKKFRNIERIMIKIDITKVNCRLCPAKIDTLDDFKRHVTSVHNKKYYFDTRDSVLPFKLTADDIKCALCETKFPYFHALNKHMNVHFSNYVCETCGLGFVDKGRFVMHQQRHEEGDYPCQTCGKMFKGQYNRDLHIDRVHKKRGRVYCPKCDVMLMSYHQKLKHLVEAHGDAPLSFPCDSCARVFESRRTLTIHRRKDHLKDYRYECHCCGQKFFTRFSLNNHMPTHTGERNFKCKVCDKTYPRHKTLKDHMRIHTNDRRYRCHICGQAFIQNCSLKGHMKSQHPEYG